MPRYNQPERGTSNWHVPLNKNFADLGTEVINEVETFADLPSPSGATSSEGVSRKYLVRSTRTIYRDAGGTWEAIAGTGAFGIKLNGSGDPSEPRKGLAKEIRSALDDRRSYIDITGAWRIDRGLSVDSTDFSPNPILIDAGGAYIEYGGSGWAFTNDCTGNISEQIDGGVFSLHGGFWRATGAPSGFWRGIDQAFARLFPHATQGFSADGKQSVIYQLEIGERWCESNSLGGRHHLVDIGVKGVGSPGDSFQDNYIRNINFGAVTNYGFDLSGNWIDCKIENPTCIVGAEDAAMIRNNGNMEGTEITAPEIEDAASDLDNFYAVEIGPEANRGPYIRGGKFDRPVELTLFNTTNASGKWSWHMDYAREFDQIRLRAGSDGNRRMILNASGLEVQSASSPNGPWSRQGSI